MCDRLEAPAISFVVENEPILSYYDNAVDSVSWKQEAFFPWRCLVVCLLYGYTDLLTTGYILTGYYMNMTTIHRVIFLSHFIFPPNCFDQVNIYLNRNHLGLFYNLLKVIMLEFCVRST